MTMVGFLSQHASFFPAAAQRHTKSEREKNASSQEEERTQQREPPQHFQILGEIRFLFLG